MTTPFPGLSVTRILRRPPPATSKAPPGSSTPAGALESDHAQVKEAFAPCTDSVRSGGKWATPAAAAGSASAKRRIDDYGSSIDSQLLNVGIGRSGIQSSLEPLGWSVKTSVIALSGSGSSKLSSSLGYHVHVSSAAWSSRDPPTPRWRSGFKC